jgi:hypothetical protein
MLLPLPRLCRRPVVKILSSECKHFVTKVLQSCRNTLYYPARCSLLRFCDGHVGRAPTVKSTGVSHLVTARSRDANWPYD